MRGSTTEPLFKELQWDFKLASLQPTMLLATLLS